MAAAAAILVLMNKIREEIKVAKTGLSGCVDKRRKDTTNDNDISLSFLVLFLILRLRHLSRKRQGTQFPPAAAYWQAWQWAHTDSPTPASLNFTTPVLGARKKESMYAKPESMAGSWRTSWTRTATYGPPAASR